MPTTIDDLQAVERLVRSLDADKLAELVSLPGVQEALRTGWTPNPGPQTAAYECEADELFYGGQAGGGKTDLLLGLAYTAHKRSLILRRTNKEASRLIQRFSEIVGHRDGWNGQAGTFTLPNRLIELGGCQLEEDKQKFKGDPKDLIGFDEVSDFLESQYRFIIGWNRSADKTQRCRVVATGNPPTRPEGLWVLKYWGAWLDPTHPNPAEPGELRWYTTVEGKDQEVDGPGPHKIGDELIRARSRTFIRARLQDNPDLAETDYDSVLAALPSELKAAYREGRFDVSLRDDDWQVIPTSWILAAQDRWSEDGWRQHLMTVMAIDCAGGGNDPAALAMRHGYWYAPIVTVEGAATADGTAMVSYVLRHRRHACPIVIDVGGGYAGSLIERLKDNNIGWHRFDGSARSTATAKGSNLRYTNKRAEAIWRFREALDPDQEGGSPIALPKDPELRAELASIRYEHTAAGIKIEDKDKIRQRIGRSTNKADAVIMALSEGEKAILRNVADGPVRAIRNIMGYAAAKRRGRRW